MIHDEPPDAGSVGVEYGLIIAVVGAVLLAVLIVLGEQFTEVYNLLVDKTLDERVNTTIVS